MSNSRAAFLHERADPDPNINTGTGTSSRGNGEVSLNVYKPGFIDTTSEDSVKESIDRELAALSKALFQTSETADGAYEELKELIVEGPSGEVAWLKEQIHLLAEEDKALAARITSLGAQVDDNKAEIKKVEIAYADADKALAADIAKLKAEVDGNTAEIQRVSIAYAEADKALAADITKLRVDVDGNKANIDRIDVAYAAADVALGVRIDNLSTSVGGNTAEIKRLETAISTGDTALAGRIDSLTSTVNGNTAEIKRVEGAYAEADKAISGRVDSLTSTVGSNTAKISAVEVAYAEADKVVSSKVDRVEGELNGKIGSVQTTAQTALDKAGNVESKWGVSVDANGKVAGIELNNGSKGSEFSIRADKFSFSDTSGKQSGGFSSSNGVTTFQGAINVNNKFIVDTSGNVATHGSVVADNFIGNTGYFYGDIYAKNLRGSLYLKRHLNVDHTWSNIQGSGAWDFDVTLGTLTAEDFDRNVWFWPEAPITGTLSAGASINTNVTTSLIIDGLVVASKTGKWTFSSPSTSPGNMEFEIPRLIGTTVLPAGKGGSVVLRTRVSNMSSGNITNRSLYLKGVEAIEAFRAD